MLINNCLLKTFRCTKPYILYYHSYLLLCIRMLATVPYSTVRDGQYYGSTSTDLFIVSGRQYEYICITCRYIIGHVRGWWNLINNVFL